MCCSLCHFKNLHNGHKLIEISEDKGFFKKENMTIESSNKEFNEAIKKAENLKKMIKKEIKKVDDLYNQINNEVAKSFQIKYEKLIKEEKELKEVLQNEVTKVKEKLEKFLSDSNMTIQAGERINKGIKILEKEKETNILKVLTYISKINKNQKEISILLRQFIYEKFKNFI